MLKARILRWYKIFWDFWECVEDEAHFPGRGFVTVRWQNIINYGVLKSVFSIENDHYENEFELFYDSGNYLNLFYGKIDALSYESPSLHHVSSIVLA